VTTTPTYGLIPNLGTWRTISKTWSMAVTLIAMAQA
jgi:hypothetical protein